VIFERQHIVFLRHQQVPWLYWIKWLPFLTLQTQLVAVVWHRVDLFPSSP